MADVVFAIGSRPTLPADDAEALARFLELGRNADGLKLCAKIREHLAADDDDQELELDRDELKTIVALFADAPNLLEAPPGFPSAERRSGRRATAC